MQELKSNNILWSVSFAFISILSLSRCSTEVDLNAPYESIPIVFGLLDAEVDTQWVRINRTWLGEGDQNIYALIQDSSEYENSRLVAKFSEVNGGGVYELKDTILENKDVDGAFFAPEYKAYYAVTNGSNALNEDSEYKLEIEIDDTTNVEAQTNLIKSEIGSITQPPIGQPDIKMGFASVGSINVTYPEYTFKWTSTEGASRYDAVLVVHYVEKKWANDELTDIASIDTTFMEIAIGSVTTNNDEVGQELTKVFSGSAFFNNMASRLEVNPRITRELGVWNEGRVEAFDFVLMIANEDLATFLEFNEPVTNIIQERPEYTNVNGGLGLWGSRTEQKVEGRGYTTDTIEHLIEGDGTAALNFCHPNPSSDYFCQ